MQSRTRTPVGADTIMSRKHIPNNIQRLDIDTQVSNGLGAVHDPGTSAVRPCDHLACRRDCPESI